MRNSARPLSFTLLVVAYAQLAATATAELQAPSLSGLTTAERTMIESACKGPHVLNGRAAYYRCLDRQLSELRTLRNRPSLADVTSAERTRIESACNGSRLLDGPAAYYRCLDNQISRLRAIPNRIAQVDEPSGNLETESQDVRATVDPSTATDSTAFEDIPSVQELEQELDFIPRDERIPSTPRETREKLSERHDTEDTRAQQTDLPAQVPAKIDPNSVKPVAATLAAPVRTATRRAPYSAIGLVVAGLLLVTLVAYVNKVSPCPKCGQPTKPIRPCQGCAALDAARGAQETRDAVRRANEAREAAEERRREEKESRERIRSLDDLNRMNGAQFEKLIESLFVRDGYLVFRREGTGNESIDLVLDISDVCDVVQCKRWSGDVGPTIVREFYGAMSHLTARHGFIVTTAQFTAAARAWVQNKRITLIDGTMLLNWLQGSFDAAKEASSEQRFDAYAELELSENATDAEVKTAYRRLMTQYHPDRVGGLGPEIQEFAKRKAQAINRAYSLVRRERGWA